jgi:hypothetical protein
MRGTGVGLGTGISFVQRLSPDERLCTSAHLNMSETRKCLGIQQSEVSTNRNWGIAT